MVSLLIRFLLYTDSIGNILIQMYAVKHPSYNAQAWHVFVTYLLVTILACAIVCCFNKVIPRLNEIGIIVLVAGALVTVLVCIIMPATHGRLASTSSVWTDWSADIGYPNGFVFVAGMLNGAYAMEIPDSTSHLTEEIPSPSRNVPKAITLQFGIGFVTGLAYLIAVLYAVHDYSALSQSSLTIAEIYYQATGSSTGTIGLLCLLLLPTLICVISLYVTCGRTLWALARDKATPFPDFLGRVDPRLGIPLNATLSSLALVLVLGCIYIGSTTAFDAFVGSFVLMSSISYIAAILPLLVRGRKGIPFGPFRMNHNVGFVMNFVACGYMIV